MDTGEQGAEQSERADPLEKSKNFWVISDRALLEKVAEGGKAALQEEPAALEVRGDCVARILPAAELRAGALRDEALAKGIEIIDVGSAPLVPSFVNAHTHLSLAPLRGITSQSNRSKNVVTDVFFELERHLCHEDVRAFTRFGAIESLLSGVGEVWDHYYFGEAVAQGLCDAGLPGVVAPTLQDLAGPFQHAAEQQLEATERVANSLQFREQGVRASSGTSCNRHSQ